MIPGVLVAKPHCFIPQPAVYMSNPHTVARPSAAFPGKSGHRVFQGGFLGEHLIGTQQCEDWVQNLLAAAQDDKALLRPESLLWCTRSGLPTSVF